jgi:hypothetical protein
MRVLWCPDSCNICVAIGNIVFVFSVIVIVIVIIIIIVAVVVIIFVIIIIVILVAITRGRAITSAAISANGPSAG